MKWILLACLVALTGCAQTERTDTQETASPVILRMYDSASRSFWYRSPSSEAPIGGEAMAYGPSVGHRPVAKVVGTSAEYGFEPPIVHAVPGPEGETIDYIKLLAVDVSGDGLDDLIALPSQRRVEIFVQQPDGRMAEPQIFPYGSGYGSPNFEAVVSDFNGDGRQDIAHAAYEISSQTDPPADGAIFMLINKGGGKFERKVAFTADGKWTSNWQLHDVNRDGNVDIVGLFSSEDGGQYRTSLKAYYSDGKGEFAKAELLPFGSSTTGIQDFRILDLDGDGYLDYVIAVASQYDAAARGEVAVYYGTRGGTLHGPFVAHKTPTAAGSSLAIEYADINGDGLLDSIQLSEHMGLRPDPEIRLQTAPRIYGNPVHLVKYGQIFPMIIRAADLDGDGRTDLVSNQILGFGNLGTVPYLQRGGTLMAGEPTSLLPYHHTSYLWTRDYFAVGDFNGDGCNDVAVASGVDGILFLRGKNCRITPRITGGNLPPRLIR